MSFFGERNIRLLRSLTEILGWALVSVVTSIISSYMVFLVSGHPPDSGRLEKISDVGYWIGAILVAPIIETALTQALPYIWTHRLQRAFVWFMTASVSTFFILHLLSSIWQAVAVLPAGIVFAFVYWRYGQKFGNRTAAGSVIALHAIHNATVLLSLVVLAA